jgi:L-threonylcarbamoyladenylate synthase
MTKIIKINPARPEKNLIQSAARIIQKGGLVAFPTETVYGIGADALNEKAVRKIFLAKGRPSGNPMIVHIADRKDFSKLVSEVPLKAERLMKFWPGPLTIVAKKAEIIPGSVTAGLDTVAIRMPDNRIAIELIKAAGPIAAPSANLSGRPSATTAGHVIDDLYGKVDAIIDGGNTDVGIESTVIDMSKDVPVLLRPGKITLEELRRVLGRVSVTERSDKPRSPGMKYEHYKPRPEVILVKNFRKLDNLAKDFRASGKKVAIIAATKAAYDADEVEIFSKPEKFARSLFSSFRFFEKNGINVILVEALPEKRLGLAIMNRLKKAASRTI